MMRRLQQKVTRARQGGYAPDSNASSEIGFEMHVRAFQQAQRNFTSVELTLQCRDCRPDTSSGVLVQSRINMRSACDGANSIPSRNLRHGQRHIEIDRAIVDAWKYVAMKIDHVTYRENAVHGGWSSLLPTGSHHTL